METRKKVVVLGAGRVGRAIARDLSTRFDVLAVDTNLRALHGLDDNIIRTYGDATNPERLGRVVGPMDLVVNALPGHLGFGVLRNLIELGKNVVDISFAPEDFLELHELAKEKGVLVVPDCGVAPGLSNMLLGIHYFGGQKVQAFSCCVGGLPKYPARPWLYKAPFSPIDVLAEYTRPARMVENGVIVTKPALSDTELLDFEDYGVFEAFNTDGLRTLLHTVKVPNMVEKTLRYPGHRDLVAVLRDTGCLSSEPMEVGGAQIRPIDLTAKLLFPFWQLAEGEEEFTIMMVEVDCGESGTHLYFIYDEYDKASGLSSMARTTGYTATAVASMMLEGKMSGRVGILPPECLLTSLDNMTYVFGYLTERGITITHDVISDSGNEDS